VKRLLLLFLILATAPAWAQTTYYYTSIAANPYQVFRDGTRLTQVPSQAALATGDWWWDSTDSYIWVYDNPAGHLLEASVRNNCININGQGYITLAAVDCEKGLQQGIYSNGNTATNLTANGIASNNNVLEGMLVGTPGSTSNPLTGLLIEYSTFSYNGEHGFIFEGSANGTIVQYSTFHHNCLGIDVGYTAWCAGLRALGNDPPTGERPLNTIYQYNLVYDNGITGDNRGLGIHFDTTGAGSQIRYNQVYGNGWMGIVLENTSDTADTSAQSQAIIGNLVYNQQTYVTYSSGIYLYRQSKYNVIANNTVYGNGYNIEISGLYGGSDPVGMIGNVISNNISENWGLSSLLTQYGGENDGTNGSGNIYTYNAWGTAASDFIQWSATPSYFSTYAAFDAGYGSSSGVSGTTHSIQTAPTFTNASTGNFTLPAGSSAIGAGLTLGSSYQNGLNPAYSTWINGLVTSPQPAPWDIGAFVSCCIGSLASGAAFSNGSLH